MQFLNRNDCIISSIAVSSLVGKWWLIVWKFSGKGLFQRIENVPNMRVAPAPGIGSQVGFFIYKRLNALSPRAVERYIRQPLLSNTFVKPGSPTVY
jgi:hypothetical protein